MLLKNIIRFVSLIYLSVLFYIVFIQGERHQLLSWRKRINIMPIKSLIRFYQTNPHVSRFYFIFFAETFGNILLFFPFGFLFKCLYPQKRFQAIVLYGLMLSIGIEVTQLLFQIGICDIDDIILNVSGAAAGVFVYDRIISSKRKQLVFQNNRLLF